MKISILTLFPDSFYPLQESIIKRAQEKELVKIDIIDIRDFSIDKHHKCDDIPFGGGAGMVMTAQPIYDAIMSIDPKHEYLRIYMSPKGQTLTQVIAQDFVKKYYKIIILCGHYEGIDQRVIDLCIDKEISIGDYVLTGGELPAMVFVDCLSRLIPGVLGSFDSTIEESFSSGSLEYPHYTRPQNFMGLEVPKILLSGHHKNIEDWRKAETIKITKARRPDLEKKNER